ncbi:AgmX/PglI C-terminal domain-containing protein [Pseudenhygromyxa sp. WMMC2535]|uniref:AgmX/PglI C-terminal domain-containing protein n=1 Tax=Pseudenhygromyxa sp. WMMC2535 TaxID=2712867 RepID=UPI001555EEFD|nr:AgmX/PglI C-terminal domain-containing protein [Pseudenhygromyxa sp. WMMC2535]NVB39705.1 AgmX/PglI C-terminal domain-containing protein [Pseudenhygromyxa sp. WMMC2535]
MSTRTTTAALTLGLALLTSACSFAARDTDSYREDTSQLLDTREGQLQACYDQELTRSPDMAGKLTVTFTVQEKSGELTSVTWDRDRSTVSESLATCVVTALGGLALDPPDQRAGEATFSYTFANSAPTS